MRFSFYIFVTFNIIHKKLFFRNLVEIGNAESNNLYIQEFSLFLKFLRLFYGNQDFLELIFPVVFDSKNAGRFKSTCGFCKTKFSRNRTHFT